MYIPKGPCSHTGFGVWGSGLVWLLQVGHGNHLGPKYIPYSYKDPSCMLVNTPRLSFVFNTPGVQVLVQQLGKWARQAWSVRDGMSPVPKFSHPFKLSGSEHDSP